MALLDRDAAALDGLAGEFDGDHLLCETDVTDESSVSEAMTQVATEFGGIDVLVANAAVQLFGADAAVHELDRSVWDATIAVNLTGVFLTCKYGVRALLGSGGGSVICTASPTGILGIAPGFDAYSASKGGVLALARVMASDYASHGIRVNSVVPGVTATPLITALTDDADALGRYLDQIPLGRVGTPADVTGIMTYLASDESTYATGGVFVVDGGITACG